EKLHSVSHILWPGARTIASMALQETSSHRLPERRKRSGVRAVSVGRATSSDRLRRSERPLLGSRKRRRELDCDAGWARSLRSGSAIPPTDGLRRRHPGIGELRRGIRLEGAVRKRCPPLDHSACVPRPQRLLRPRAARLAARLLLSYGSRGTHDNALSVTFV